MCSRCRGCSSRLRGFRLRAGYRVVSAGGRAPAPPRATRRAFGEHGVACLHLRRLLCHPAVLAHACAVLDSATDVPGKCCRRAMRASAQATIAVKSLPPEPSRAGIRDGSSTSRPDREMAGHQRAEPGYQARTRLTLQRAQRSPRAETQWSVALPQGGSVLGVLVPVPVDVEDSFREHRRDQEHTCDGQQRCAVGARHLSGEGAWGRWGGLLPSPPDAAPRRSKCLHHPGPAATTVTIRTPLHHPHLLRLRGTYAVRRKRCATSSALFLWRSGSRFGSDGWVK